MRREQLQEIVALQPRWRYTIDASVAICCATWEAQEKRIDTFEKFWRDLTPEIVRDFICPYCVLRCSKECAMQSSITSVPSIEGTDVLLQTFGEKMTTGRDLTNPEGLISISATKKDQEGQYGPTPENFSVKTMDLPPSTVGNILNHTI